MPSRTLNRTVTAFLLCLVAMFTAADAARSADEARSAEVPRVVGEIRTEASRANFGPEGRPLPVVSHWNRGSRPDGFSPDYQVELIRQGHHVMPWFEFPHIGSKRDNDYFQQYKAAFQQVAAWKLPFTLVGTQWELILEKSQFDDQVFPFKSLPPEKNAMALNAKGEPDPRLGLSPLGAIEPWHEAGLLWTQGAMMRQLQEIYPDPPRVLLLSNNEAPKVRWHESKNGGIEADKRYLDRFGPGKSGDFKRQVIGDGFIERYKSLFGGMRDGLVSPAWKKNVRFVAYNAFGPDHMGRWDGWPVYSQHSKGRFDWGPYAWDGSSPSYYTHNWDASTDFRVHGPPISFMNYVMALRQVYEKRPDYWFEMSVWDGSMVKSGQESGKWSFYEKHGEKYTPVRHGSYVEFGMWLVRPRMVREWRGYLDTRERVGAYFEAIVNVVDRVYANPMLVRFWRKAELVPNRAHKHPYQSDVPEEYRDEDRWYLLDTELDPARPWNLETELPVQSIALVLGEKGNREWLVYARSPLKDRAKVGVTVPEYQTLKLDVPIAGAFYHLREQDKSVTRVGR